MALATWALAPATELVVARSVPADTAAFYRPVVAQIELRAHGEPSRVEVVPTTDHWEAVDVAEHVPIARGWERQLDVRLDPLFYRPGRLRAPEYLRWLRAHGVGWVALPAAGLDGSGRAEAALLHRGVPGLTPVWADRDWRLWRVSGSALVDGPARLVAVVGATLRVVATGPGSVILRERWTIPWSATGSACAARSPGGWIELRLLHAGPVTLRPGWGTRQPCGPG